MDALFTIVGSLIASLGFIPYLRDTIKGKVRPRLASWTTWSLVTGIATVAAISEGAYTSAWLTGLMTAIEIAILVVALKKGVRDYNWVDAVCQVLSFVGIVAWLQSSNASYAILFNIIADFFGAVPTFYHAWIKPHDEAWKPFIIDGIGSNITMLAVSEISLVAAGFPLYFTLMGYTLGATIYYRQKMTPKKVRQK